MVLPGLNPLQISPDNSQSSQNASEPAKTFVFMHSKTTGVGNGQWFDHLETSTNSAEFIEAFKNLLFTIKKDKMHPRITELSLMAIPRKTFERGIDEMRKRFNREENPKIATPLFHASKLTLQFDPDVSEKQYQASLNLLRKEKPFSKLDYAKRTFDPECRATFREQWKLAYSFLQTLPGPVCLVAHCGFSFNFAVLFGELLNNELFFPPGIRLLDTFYAYKNLERISKFRIEQIIKSDFEGILIDPWRYFKQEGLPIAILKRYKNCFVKIEGQPWIFKSDLEKLNYKMENMYQTIFERKINGDFSEERSEATLLVSMAFGTDFLYYLDKISVVAQ